MGIENPNPTTYADWAKTRDPDGGTADIVEIQAQVNPIMEDAFVKESNMTEGHQSTVRANLPRGTWSGFNEGVLPVKSASRQVFDKPGYLSTYGEVDKRLADLESDKAAFMMSESAAVLQGLGLDHSETLFYGNNEVSPKKFMGIMPRYNSTSLESARNIINADPGGGQPAGGANTSIYIVTWGQRTAFEFFPKGTSAGIKMKDLGEVTLFDVNGGRFQGYRQFYEQWIGFTLVDWRSCARIAQIDATALAGDLINLAGLLTTAVHRLRGNQGGKTVIYCNEAVYTWFDLQAQRKANVYLTMREWAGQEIVHWRGMPIRKCDSILSTEANVTGLTVDDGGGTF